jgi:hypothetical protein
MAAGPDLVDALQSMPLALVEVLAQELISDPPDRLLRLTPGHWRPSSKAALTRRVRHSMKTTWEAFEAEYVNGLHPELQRLWRRVRQGDRCPPLDHVVAAADVAAEMTRTFIEVLSQLRPPRSARTPSMRCR